MSFNLSIIIIIYKDSIIIADSEFGKQVLLYSTGSPSTFIQRNEDSFEPEWIIDENTMSKIGGDFTVESMKNIFSGIDGVYSSYEECYTAIAKKYYFDIELASLRRMILGHTLHEQGTNRL